MSLALRSNQAPHLSICRGEDVSRVIVCGSPERAEYISGFIKNARLIGKHREYHSFLGEFESKQVLVCSHGVGASGAAICFRELISLGAKKIIRLGTAGGLQSELGHGSIIVARGSVRDEGVTHQMLPSSVPAIPNFELTLQLERSLAELGCTFRSGMILTRDLYYDEVLSSDYSMWSRLGLLAVEMEASALFVLGLIHGIETAAMFALDGNLMLNDDSMFDPNPAHLEVSMRSMVLAGLQAI